MEHVNLIGKLLVWAVVSVVPLFFVYLFASSGYRTLRNRHARWVQAEAALTAAPLAAQDLRAERDAALDAYRACRRTVWGRIWGTLCGLPPS